MEEKMHVVVPGDILGTEEEFIPGEETYTDSEGNIRAQNAGIVKVDEERRISVHSDKKLEKLKVGDVVYGRVEEMFESVAFLTIEHPNSEELGRVDRMSAVIPVSEIRDGFVKSIRDELHVGDIVMGAVKEITPLRIVVSLKPKGMGIVMAYCSYDRKKMFLRGRTLVCSECGQKEERHLSENYGRFEFVESAEMKTQRKVFQRRESRGRRLIARSDRFEKRPFNKKKRGRF